MAAAPAAAPSGAPIRLDDVTHHFAAGGQRRAALTHVTLDARPGEFLSIIGPSGCGKSTLLRLIAGLLPLQQGTITVAGGPSRQAQRRGLLGVIFQHPALLPWRTVEANLRLPLEVRRGATTADATPLLKLVGLEGFGGYYPHQLSGGMQQRTALARALITDPPILLMDEPFAALDEITRTELRHELLRITADAGKTVIFVTHSLVEAVLLSDRVAVMTPSPGAIRAVVTIDLPRPRSAALEDTDQFFGYVRRLRALLQEG